MPHNKQKGFTLIELIVAMLIAAIIIPAIVMLFQTMNTSNSKMTNQANAVNQLKNAINYITMDTQEAANVSCPTGNFPLTLNWVSIETGGPTDQMQATYTLTNGVLTRNYYLDGALQNTRVVANSVTASSLVWPYMQSGVTTSDTLQVNLTVSTVSRTFVVYPRVVQNTLIATTTTIGAPTVTGISPNSGMTNGGNSVTITGTNLLGVSAVHFGSASATSFANGGATQITVTSPKSGAAGTVDITVTTPGGTSVTSPADRFTYVAAPTVSSISPNSGPTTGNTSVTITGTNFSGATAVNFGPNTATYTINSPSKITATSPSSTIAGSVDITVTTAGGTSVTSNADQFTYTAILMVTGISPTAGPLAGGTVVTITGMEFTGVTGVKFGSNIASYAFISDTSITATSPAGSGTVDITVTTPSGTSPTSYADQFTYQATPTVTLISPISGPLRGGTIVTIAGTNLTGATAVNFGANAAITYTVNSATSITATSPAGSASTVDITVTSPSGTSSTSSADKFTYQTGPTVTGISPTSGLLDGGSAVTITGTNFLGATAVNFGVNSAAFTINSATQITATSPSGVAGTVDVTVATPSGTSIANSHDQFTYVTAIPMALDGQGSKASSNNSVAVSLTTTDTNDVLYISIFVHSGTVSSITSNPNLPWTSRASVLLTGTDHLQTYYAIWSSSGTITITIQTSGTNTVAEAFGISGANTTSPFDVTTPNSSTGTGTSASTSITTSNANDFIIGATGLESNSTPNCGSSFTLVGTQTDNVSGATYETSDEYEVVSTTQSNLSVGYTWSGSCSWGMIADAVKQALPVPTFAINIPNVITYGATSMTLSATLTSGGTGLSGQTISFAVNGGSSVQGTTNTHGLATVSYPLTKINAGTDTGGISASFAGNSNYSPSNITANLNVNPLAITVTATTNTKTYDGTTTAAAVPTITTGSLATGDTATWTEKYSSDNVGTSVILTPAGMVSDGNGGANYNVTYATVNTGVINALAITVTAGPSSKPYDGTTTSPGTPTITTGSLASGDTASWMETYDNKNVGITHVMTVTPAAVSDGNGGANYTVTYATINTGVITAKALTVSGITAGNKTYDGTTTEHTISTTSAALVGVVSGDTVTLSTSSATGVFASKNAGNGVTVNISGLTISGSSASNYSLTQPTATANITALAITVTAGASSKTYDGTTTSPGTPTITSGALAPGDTSPAWVETYDNKNVGTTHVMTVTPAAVNDGNGGANYTVTYKTISTGVISKLAITVTAGASSKTYDGTTTSPGTPTITTGSLASGDTASWVETYDNKNAGTTHVMTVTPAAVSDGNGGANYTVTYKTINTGVIYMR